MVYNLNSIDILAKRNDGGVELYIVSTGGMDDSAKTQTTLMDKIQNYLRYISSNEFADEFGKLEPEKIRIVLQIDEPLSLLYEELFKRIAPWVGSNGAHITLEMSYGTR